MTARKYKVEIEGSDGWTRWVQPSPSADGTMDEYRIACCDCGLVHDLQFRVVDGRVQFRASRNQRVTGQLRRQMINRGEGLVAPAKPKDVS